MTRLLGMFSVLLIVGCVTSGKPAYKKTKVVERIQGVSDTPDWTSGRKITEEKDGVVYYYNSLSMSGDARPEACMKGSELEARSNLLRTIKESITTSGQLSETSVTSDPSYESLTAFLSQGNISNANITERYWEKAEVSSETGERVLRMRCSAKLAIKRKDLERQLSEAVSPQGNPEIRAALLKAQAEFLGGLKSE